MNAKRIAKTATGYLGRLPLCAAAYVAGAMGSAALVWALGMPLPKLPEQTDERTMGLCQEQAAIER
jgi:hypothetical protein